MIAAFSLVAATCGPSNASPTSGSVDGAYSGNGAGALSIAFTVSGNGSSITQLGGTVLFGCSNLSGSASHNVNYGDHNAIHVAADGSFSDQYTDGTATITLNGSLDHRGGASGFLVYQETSCSSPNLPWHAALAGVSPPALPSLAATPAPSCSPPCASVGDLTFSVDGTYNVTNQQNQTPAILVQLTVSNAGSSSVNLQVTTFSLASGTNPSLTAEGIAAVTDQNNSTVYCDDGNQVAVDPQQDTSMNLCFSVPDPGQSGEPLTLTVQASGQPAKIDLGSAS